MIRRRLALAFTLASACLPEGGPGLGQQMVAARGLADVGFAPQGLIFTRSAALAPEVTLGGAPAARDLYLHPLEGNGERALATGLPSGVRATTLTDARGRLLVQRAPLVHVVPGDQPPRTSWELVRLDLGSGAEVSLGRVRLARQSASRALLYLEGPVGPAQLRTLDDHQQSVAESVRDSRFIGEDLYLLGAEALVEVKDGAAPVTLEKEVSAFRPLPGPERAFLVMRPHNGSSPAETEILVVRSGAAPVSIVRTRLSGDVFVAPDRRRLALIETGDGGSVGLRLIDLDEGTSRLVPLARPPGGGGRQGRAIDVTFRPGSDEVWVFIGQALRVVRPDGTVLAIDRAVHTLARISPGRGADRLGPPEANRGRIPRGSPFSADGARWIFRGPDGLLRLGDADDPASEEGVVVSAAGGDGNVIELRPSQRFAVFLEPGDDRQDLYVLDAGSRSLRFAARDVGATWFGGDRALAIARKVGDRRATGELVLLDLASGAETLIARNVSELALAAACPGCDPTAPGASLAYVVQARVPWPHEGLWLATLP